VGIYGLGTSGAGGPFTLGVRILSPGNPAIPPVITPGYGGGGYGGSGGFNGGGGGGGPQSCLPGGSGGKYGGGGGAAFGAKLNASGGKGSAGFVRILWPNKCGVRRFPSTNVGLS
jgi:hypothetical protein